MNLNITEKRSELMGGRDSNLELFRILSMLVIVAHHYVVNSGLLECIDAQTKLQLKDYFSLLFGWGGKTGINCFVLITGYFMCTSHITKQKFCKLLGEYYFYTIGIWAVFLLTGYEAFSVKDLLQVLFPFFSVSNGFTSCFLSFYLLIPFLNKMIHALTQQEHFLLMMWCLCVYVVLPSFAKAEVTFNYVTWFSILYIIAAYLRLYPQSWFESSRITGMIALVCLILSWWSVVILAWLSRLAEKGIWLSYFFVSDSNKVLALATGGSLFLFFRSLKLGYSKCINTIAASTFGVLMIHANSDTMRRWLWRDVCNNVGAYTVGNVVPHAVVCVVIIYAVCTLIDMGRIWLLRHIRFGIKS